MANINKININPSELHGIWLLLNKFDVFNLKKLDSLAQEVFGVASQRDIQNLLERAELLNLVDKSAQGWTTNNNYGSTFASLKHWRLWQVPDKLKNVINQLNIQHYFLSDDDYQNRPIIIDLFSGVGGLGLGFAAEGFDVKFAFDNDPQACEAHRKNFPECKVIETDLRKISQKVKNILSEDIDPSRIFGIIGGPPCQGFSHIGERNPDDERNLLTSHFIDVVLDIEPSFFVMENVVGLKSSGERPELLAFLKRYSNPIGDVANKIVESLPPVNRSIAKRERQYRRRIISRTISELIKRYAHYFEIGLFFNSFEKTQVFLQNIYCDLEKSLFKSLESEYSTEKLFNIHQILLSHEVDLYKIVISFCLQYSLRNKKNIKKDLEQTLKEWSNSFSEKKLSKACQLLLSDYYQIPKAVNYKGIKIGSVLGHLIERVSTKYEVAVPTTLNSAWYGCPQNRERLFLIGIHKRHQQHFIFPEPQFKATGKRNKKATLDNLSNAPTTFEALGDLPDVDQYEFLLEKDTLPIYYLSSPVSQLTSLLRLQLIDDTDKSLPRPSWNPFLLDCCLRTQHPDHVIKRIKNTPEGKSEGISGRTRLHRNSVSHTLRAGTREDKGSHTANRPVHYEYNRVITVREGARLMGYPDWMTFHHTKWHGFRLVGNGVPLHLGRSIARQIRELLL